MKVIVVGCGLSGLATALALRTKFVVEEKKDVQIMILERRENFESRGATFGLAPCGQIALKEICPDVVEHLSKIGILIPQSGGYMLPWWEVRDALLAEARKYPDVIDIRTGMKIRNVTQDENQVTVTFEEPSADLVLEADVLIGADGVHSYVRTQVLGLSPPTSTGVYIWRGRVDVQDMPDLHVLTTKGLSDFNAFGPTIVTYFNFHSKLPNTIAWVVSSKDTSAITEGTTTPLDLVEKYMKTIEGDADEAMKEKYELAAKVLGRASQEDLTFSSEQAVVQLPEASSSPSAADDCWGRKGRTILIGDAAHALRPASGLGGSMAFEDAVMLSRLLVDSPQDQVSAALQEFQHRRLPRVKNISDDQAWRSEMAYKKGGLKSRPNWTPEYKEWLDEGPDASNDPPPAYADEGAFASAASVKP